MYVGVLAVSIILETRAAINPLRAYRYKSEHVPAACILYMGLHGYRTGRIII